MAYVLINSEIAKSISQKLICTTCARKTRVYDLIDIYQQGVVCEQNHRFYIELKSPNFQESIKLKDMPITGKPIPQNIQILLSDDEYRSKLNNQLATMLRRIYEIKVENKHVLQSKDIFQYCPICSEILTEFEQDNTWVMGLRCKQKHEFLIRDGAHFVFENHEIWLKEEMADKEVEVLVDAWLKDEQSLKKQLNQEVVDMLIWAQSHIF